MLLTTFLKTKSSKKKKKKGKYSEKQTRHSILLCLRLNSDKTSSWDFQLVCKERKSDPGKVNQGSFNSLG